MSAQPTIPCQNETLFRNNICHLHVASASAQPTMIVCPIHVLTFVLPCIILRRLLVIRVRFFITVFCNVQPFPFNFVLEYFLSIECNLPAAVHEKLLDTGYLAYAKFCFALLCILYRNNFDNELINKLF